MTMDKWVCASVSLCDMRSLGTLKTKTFNYAEELKKKSLPFGYLVLRVWTVITFLFHSYRNRLNRTQKPKPRGAE